VAGVLRIRENAPDGRTRPSAVARYQGSRVASGLNHHPQAKRSYRLRSYVTCDLCDRRMFGKARHDIAYLACEPQRQHHKGRNDWYSDHPKSLWAREEVLLDAVRAFFAQRIFGPDRRRHLRAQLQRCAENQNQDSTADRRKQLTRELAGLRRRQDNLIDQLENFEATGDTDVDREYRQSIQRRFAELTTARQAKQAELDQINIEAPPTGDDAELLDQIHRTRHEATIQVAIREDTIRTLTEAAQSNGDSEEGVSAEHDHLSPCSGRPLRGTAQTGTDATCVFTVESLRS
jgi:site-specific DNA recombinase